MTYTVGQKVWVYGINEKRGPVEGEVTKVGRTLVTVRGGYAERQYRIDTGRWNSRDFGGHYWIKTDEQRAEDERRTTVLARLGELGVEGTRFGNGLRQYDVDTLERVVAVLEGAS